MHGFLTMPQKWILTKSLHVAMFTHVQYSNEYKFRVNNSSWKIIYRDVFAHPGVFENTDYRFPLYMTQFIIDSTHNTESRVRSII